MLVEQPVASTVEESGKLVDLVEQTELVPVIVQDAPEKDAARGTS